MIGRGQWRKNFQINKQLTASFLEKINDRQRFT